MLETLMLAILASIAVISSINIIIFYVLPELA
jgi:hypothetical protein